MINKIYLVRHGETSWSLSGQHTGKSDIDLTPNGEAQARKLKDKLGQWEFSSVFCSPLKRAKRTCELAGMKDRALYAPELSEWDYGQYEGLTTKEIQKQDLQWNIFLNGAPGGESVEAIQKRADCFLQKIRAHSGDILLFSHAHFLRVLAARWLTLAAQEGKHLVLSPGSLSILGFERQEPVLLLWNQL